MKFIYLLSSLSLCFVVSGGNGYNHLSNEDFSRSQLKIMKRQLLQSAEPIRLQTTQCVPGVDAACSGFYDSGNLHQQDLQQGCTDEAPPNATFSCSMYAQLNYCNNIGGYCNKSCGKCTVCEDILVPGINSCSIVVSADTCSDPGVKGIYCNKSCNNCPFLHEATSIPSAASTPTPTPIPSPIPSINLEVNALIAFRDAISDPSQLSDWIGNSPCFDRWTGISCDQNQVTIIEYTGTDVFTSIPPEFSVLKQLKKILLAEDAITGTLPPELSLLINMEEFEIGDHMMKGTIPVELSTWTNIRIFDMEAASSGSLTGSLPKQLSTWTNLKYFQILDNELSGTLPAELCTWSRNDIVQLSNNKFSGSVPKEYLLWESYSDLYLYPQVSSNFCISQSLQYQLVKSITFNDINELSICGQNFSFDGEAGALQQFKYAIKDPSLLGSWVGDDPCDNWQGIKCDSEQVSVVVYPHSTDVTTSIPPEFSELKGLKKLLLQYDAVTGTIPPELSVLVEMEEFNIEEHTMKGTIPQQLSTWTNIQIFNLEAASGGSLTGRLPQQLSTWTNLKEFNVFGNDLTGTLPPELSTWSSSDSIELDYNKFSGSTPEEYSLWEGYWKVSFIP